MFKKGTGYSKACLVCLMLVCRLGKKYFIFFQPKYLATIDLTPPNCLEKELVYDSIFV